MRAQYIPPFYFPTTVVFIDDNADFLANLSLQLDANLAFQLYDSPNTALAMINTKANATKSLDKFFAYYRSIELSPFNDHVVGINPDKIHREIHNENRFKQISVIVVDYDMPSMNGLDFCRQLTDPALKKILLTGKADEKTAVQAFNQGIIDCFIPKHDVTAISSLNHAIKDLQQSFFLEIENSLANMLTTGFYTFLNDPIFIAEFRKICTSYKIVEFYLSSKPEGILMFTADAVPILLLVQTDEELFSQYEIAFDQAAPEELLSALKSNEFVPYFWRTKGVYRPECIDWHQYLFSADVLKGQKWYYYSLIKNPAGVKLEGVISYNQFIEQLDQEGGSNTRGKFYQLRNTSSFNSPFS